MLIGSLWKATTHKLNEEYQREEKSEGVNNNYMDGVTLKGTGWIPQAG